MSGKAKGNPNRPAKTKLTPPAPPVPLPSQPLATPPLPPNPPAKSPNIEEQYAKVIADLETHQQNGYMTPERLQQFKSEPIDTITVGILQTEVQKIARNTDFYKADTISEFDARARQEIYKQQVIDPFVQNAPDGQDFEVKKVYHNGKQALQFGRVADNTRDENGENGSFQWSRDLTVDQPGSSNSNDIGALNVDNILMPVPYIAPKNDSATERETLRRQTIGVKDRQQSQFNRYFSSGNDPYAKVKDDAKDADEGRSIFRNPEMPIGVGAQARRARSAIIPKNLKVISNMDIPLTSVVGGAAYKDIPNAFHMNAYAQELPEGQHGQIVGRKNYLNGVGQQRSPSSSHIYGIDAVFGIPGVYEDEDGNIRGLDGDNLQRSMKREQVGHMQDMAYYSKPGTPDTVTSRIKTAAGTRPQGEIYREAMIVKGSGPFMGSGQGILNTKTTVGKQAWQAKRWSVNIGDKGLSESERETLNQMRGQQMSNGDTLTINNEKVDFVGSWNNAQFDHYKEKDDKVFFYGRQEGANVSIKTGEKAFLSHGNLSQINPGLDETDILSTVSGSIEQTIASVFDTIGHEHGISVDEFQAMVKQQFVDEAYSPKAHDAFYNSDGSLRALQHGAVTTPILKDIFFNQINQFKSDQKPYGRLETMDFQTRVDKGLYQTIMNNMPDDVEDRFRPVDITPADDNSNTRLIQTQADVLNIPRLGYMRAELSKNASHTSEEDRYWYSMNGMDTTGLNELGKEKQAVSLPIVQAELANNSDGYIVPGELPMGLANKNLAQGFLKQRDANLPDSTEIVPPVQRNKAAIDAFVSQFGDVPFTIRDDAGKDRHFANPSSILAQSAPGAGGIEQQPLVSAYADAITESMVAQAGGDAAPDGAYETHSGISSRTLEKLSGAQEKMARSRQLKRNATGGGADRSSRIQAYTFDPSLSSNTMTQTFPQTVEMEYRNAKNQGRKVTKRQIADELRQHEQDHGYLTTFSGIRSPNSNPAEQTNSILKVISPKQYRASGGKLKVNPKQPIMGGSWAEAQGGDKDGDLVRLLPMASHKNDHFNPHPPTPSEVIDRNALNHAAGEVSGGMADWFGSKIQNKMNAVRDNSSTPFSREDLTGQVSENFANSKMGMGGTYNLIRSFAAHANQFTEEQMRASSKMVGFAYQNPLDVKPIDEQTAHLLATAQTNIVSGQSLYNGKEYFVPKTASSKQINKGVNNLSAFANHIVKQFANNENLTPDEAAHMVVPSNAPEGLHGQISGMIAGARKNGGSSNLQASIVETINDAMGGKGTGNANNFFGQQAEDGSFTFRPSPAGAIAALSAFKTMRDESTADAYRKYDKDPMAQNTQKMIEMLAEEGANQDAVLRRYSKRDDDASAFTAVMGRSASVLGLEGLTPELHRPNLAEYIKALDGKEDVEIGPSQLPGNKQPTQTPSINMDAISPYINTDNSPADDSSTINFNPSDIGNAHNTFLNGVSNITRTLNAPFSSTNAKDWSSAQKGDFIEGEVMKSFPSSIGALIPAKGDPKDHPQHWATGGLTEDGTTTQWNGKMDALYTRADGKGLGVIDVKTHAHQDWGDLAEKQRDEKLAQAEIYMHLYNQAHSGDEQITQYGVLAENFDRTNNGQDLTGERKIFDADQTKVEKGEEKYVPRNGGMSDNLKRHLRENSNPVQRLLQAARISTKQRKGNPMPALQKKIEALAGLKDHEDELRTIGLTPEILDQGLSSQAGTAWVLQNAQKYSGGKQLPLANVQAFISQQLGGSGGSSGGDGGGGGGNPPPPSNISSPMSSDNNRGSQEVEFGPQAAAQMAYWHKVATTEHLAENDFGRVLQNVAGLSLSENQINDWVDEQGNLRKELRPEEAKQLQEHLKTYNESMSVISRADRPFGEQDASLREVGVNPAQRKIADQFGRYNAQGVLKPIGDSTQFSGSSVSARLNALNENIGSLKQLAQVTAVAKDEKRQVTWEKLHVAEQDQENLRTFASADNNQRALIATQYATSKAAGSLPNYIRSWQQGKVAEAASVEEQRKLDIQARVESMTPEQYKDLRVRSQTEKLNQNDQETADSYRKRVAESHKSEKEVRTHLRGYIKENPDAAASMNELYRQFESDGSLTQQEQFEGRLFMGEQAKVDAEKKIAYEKEFTSSDRREETQKAERAKSDAKVARAKRRVNSVQDAVSRTEDKEKQKQAKTIQSGLAKEWGDNIAEDDHAAMKALVNAGIYGPDSLEAQVVAHGTKAIARREEKVKKDYAELIHAKALVLTDPEYHALAHSKPFEGSEEAQVLAQARTIRNTERANSAESTRMIRESIQADPVNAAATYQRHQGLLASGVPIDEAGTSYINTYNKAYEGHQETEQKKQSASQRRVEVEAAKLQHEQLDAYHQMSPADQAAHRDMVLSNQIPSTPAYQTSMKAAEQGAQHIAQEAARRDPGNQELLGNLNFLTKSFGELNQITSAVTKTNGILTKSQVEHIEQIKKSMDEVEKHKERSSKLKPGSQEEQDYQKVMGGMNADPLMKHGLTALTAPDANGQSLYSKATEQKRSGEYAPEFIERAQTDTLAQKIAVLTGRGKTASEQRKLAFEDGVFGNGTEQSAWKAASMAGQGVQSLVSMHRFYSNVRQMYFDPLAQGADRNEQSQENKYANLTSLGQVNAGDLFASGDFRRIRAAKNLSVESRRIQDSAAFDVAEPFQSFINSHMSGAASQAMAIGQASIGVGEVAFGAAGAMGLENAAVLGPQAAIAAAAAMFAVGVASAGGSASKMGTVGYLNRRDAQSGAGPLTGLSSMGSDFLGSVAYNAEGIASDIFHVTTEASKADKRNLKLDDYVNGSKGASYGEKLSMDEVALLQERNWADVEDKSPTSRVANDNAVALAYTVLGGDNSKKNPAGSYFYQDIVDRSMVASDAGFDIKSQLALATDFQQSTTGETVRSPRQIDPSAMFNALVTQIFDTQKAQTETSLSPKVSSISNMQFMAGLKPNQDLDKIAGNLLSKNQKIRLGAEQKLSYDEERAKLAGKYGVDNTQQRNALDDLVNSSQGDSSKAAIVESLTGRQSAFGQLSQTFSDAGFTNAQKYALQVVSANPFGDVQASKAALAGTLEHGMIIDSKQQEQIASMSVMGFDTLGYGAELAARDNVDYFSAAGATYVDKATEALTMPKGLNEKEQADWLRDHKQKIAVAANYTELSAIGRSTGANVQVGNSFFENLTPEARKPYLQGVQAATQYNSQFGLNFTGWQTSDRIFDAAQTGDVASELRLTGQLNSASAYLAQRSQFGAINPVNQTIMDSVGSMLGKDNQFAMAVLSGDPLQNSMYADQHAGNDWRRTVQTGSQGGTTGMQRGTNEYITDSVASSIAQEGTQRGYMRGDGQYSVDQLSHMNAYQREDAAHAIEISTREYDFALAQKQQTRAKDSYEVEFGMETQGIRLSRTQQDFSYNQATKSLGLQREGMNLANQQFGEQQSFQREKIGYESGYQRESMNIQHGHQRTERGWQVQDIAYQQNMSAVQFGNSMIDMDENVRFSSGRQRRDAMRHRDEAVVTHSMEVGHADQEKQRAAERFKWSEDQFQRDKMHFEKDLAYQLAQMDMEKRHHDQNKSLEERRFSLEIENHTKERQFMLAQRVLEDQQRMYRHNIHEIELKEAQESLTLHQTVKRSMDDLLSTGKIVDEQLARDNAARIFAAQTGALLTQSLGLLSTAMQRVIADIQAAQQTANQSPGSNQAPPGQGGNADHHRGGRQTFAQGGYTGNGPVNEPAGIVHGQEWVIPNGGSPVVMSPKIVEVLQKIHGELQGIHADGGNAVINVHTSNPAKTVRNNMSLLDQSWSAV